MITAIATWSNDDAESRLLLSNKTWARIQVGEDYTVEAESWYEGKMYPVTWTFKDKTFDIDGENGMQCVVSGYLEDLFVEEK